MRSQNDTLPVTNRYLAEDELNACFTSHKETR